jgi:hypothetical protein
VAALGGCDGVGGGECKGRVAEIPYGLEEYVCKNRSIRARPQSHH